MKVKALAPWFGCKRTLAPAIVAELGPHTQYFEPFCGSMAVLMAKDPSRGETVNDLHGDLTNLARVIAHRASAQDLYDRLGRAIVCEALLADALRGLEGPPADERDVDRAYDFFLASWLARGGFAGTAKPDARLAVRWTPNGGSPSVRFRHAVESVPAWHERLANVVILRRDAFEVLARVPDLADTAIYVDPPYLAETRSNHDQNTGGLGRYLHDFATGGLFDAADDHDRLANALSRFARARIVVSYYDHPRLRGLYDGWTVIDCGTTKNLVCPRVGGTRATSAPEVLIVNGPPIAEAREAAS